MSAEYWRDRLGPAVWDDIVRQSDESGVAKYQIAELLVGLTGAVDALREQIAARPTSRTGSMMKQKDGSFKFEIEDA